MILRTIAQALVDRGHLVARSEDFSEEWVAETERIVAAYGQPTSDREALFTTRFGRKHVAVVAVSGHAFRFLVLSRPLFDAIPDPFAITERFPASFTARHDLPSLTWPPEPLPRRTVAQLDAVFKGGDGPFLLGACQTLVDSGRIIIRREAPDPKVCRDLWALLPDSIRRQTWVATFAPSLGLGFGLAVMPAIPESGATGYLTEDQARDYPESRYERELQTAVEHGDQPTLDRLLARRSSAETLRLAVWVLAFTAVVALAMRLMTLK
ncbi:MAG TPA: hypothetical protein VM597_04955 [Gemmataceae bacterium]|nr:hypothetical protein [Gemmataceae bacterium]